MLVLLSLTVSALAPMACGGTPARSAPVDEPPAPTKPTAYDAAREEVVRLTALANQNPLLAEWTGPYEGVPPWDKVTAAGFPKAFETGLALLLAEVAVIAENSEPATFANTIARFEDAGRHMGRAETLFAVMTGNMSTPEVQQVDEEWSPKIAAAYDKITFNAKLFARIATVYAARASAGLSAEQQRLVELRYEHAVRAGAKLSAADKAKVGKINEQLATLFTDFGNKVLADENTWIVLESKQDLAGLSPSLVAAYQAAAAERGLDGKWVVVNTRSSVDPFLTSSSRRDLREKVWKAFKNRGDNGDANDTNADIARIVKLRAERAALLGYASHAHWRMADTMAKDPEQAKALMLRVWPGAVARVKEEVAAMQKIANKAKVKITIEPWDYRYYAEKVRKAKYDLDEDEIKPYLELGKMTEAAFWMAERLYGLTFTGTVRTVIASNNNNFVRGAADTPILISVDDAQTLFHEFGHALHALLSEVNYPGLGDTPADFVEFPSQVHEMWVLTRPILDKYATHYKTGKAMPAALVKKIEASSTFNSGYNTVEYLSAAILDMELHTMPDGVVDPDAFERETLVSIGAPQEVAMRHRLPQFNHLFTSDNYSAGYYSYLWSEVMDADTREAFADAGDVFDATVAAKLREYILAPGNTTDRAEAYRQFRGRDPDVTALLKKRGFPIAE